MNPLNKVLDDIDSRIGGWRDGVFGYDGGASDGDTWVFNNKKMKKKKRGKKNVK